MHSYSFTIEVDGVNLQDSSYEDAFYEAGCGDALIVVVDGRMSLDFDRRAESCQSAVDTAISDIRRAGARDVQVTFHPERRAA